jgi:hypothetical protein
MKKHLAIGSGLIAVAVVAFLALHRPLKAPAEEQSSPAGAAAANETVAGAPGSAGSASGDAATSKAAPLSPVEFHALVDEVEKSIPSQSELRKLTPEQAHMTPKTLQSAGIQLGRVAEALENNPNLAADGLYFYEKCVLTDTNPTSVRALCLSDYEKLGERAHLPIRTGIAPANVRDLADKIKNI